MSVSTTGLHAIGLLVALLIALPNARALQQETAGGTLRGSDRPIAFVENRGQWDLEARYVVQLPGQTAFLEPDALVLLSRRPDGGGHVVRLVIEGASEDSAPEGRGELPGRYHYFFGNDPAGWRTNVLGFAQVVYRQLRPGVDMVVRVEGDHLEYDLLLEPGSSLEQVVVRAEGIEGLHVDADGALVAATSVGALKQRPPTTWEVDATGQRRPVPCRYRLLDGGRYGFSVDERRSENALVVDPGLEWSTYFGGSDEDEVDDVALGPDGSVTIVGNTYSPDLPVTAGAFDPIFARGTGVNARDAFVCQLSEEGLLVFCTYLGGTDVAGDFGKAVRLSENGEVTVGGDTSSSTFPTTSGAYQTSKAGVFDAYVTRLSADGSSLVFSTYLGGEGLGGEIVERLAVLPGGDVVLAGKAPVGFPTTPGAYQEVPLSTNTTYAFVSRLSSSGSTLLASTYLSSSNGSYIKDLVVPPNEEPIVVGKGNPPDYPFTPGALQLDSSAFVTRLSVDMTALVFSGSVGGSLGDTPRAVTLDAFGNIVIAGHTASIDLPVTPDAYDAVGPVGLLDDPDGYLVVVDPTGSEVLYCTYLGASRADNPDDVLVDSSGAFIVAGTTTGFDFPTTPGAYDEELNPLIRKDLFVTRFAPDRRTLEYSTVLGGDDDDGIDSRVSIVVDESGAVIVASDSRSGNYPTTTGAQQNAPMGGGEGVVTKLDLLPTGVRRYGSSTVGCEGALVASVTALPQVGATNFAATCTRAPPFDQEGMLVVSLAAFDGALSGNVAGKPEPAGFGTIDPLGFVSVLPVSSDVLGYSERPLRLPPMPGLEFHLQFFWPNPCPPAGGTFSAVIAPAGWSSSAALEVVVQP